MLHDHNWYVQEFDKQESERIEQRRLKIKKFLVGMKKKYYSVPWEIAFVPFFHIDTYFDYPDVDEELDRVIKMVEEKTEQEYQAQKLVDKHFHEVLEPAFREYCLAIGGFRK